MKIVSYYDHESLPSDIFRKNSINDNFSILDMFTKQSPIVLSLFPETWIEIPNKGQRKVNDCMDKLLKSDGHLGMEWERLHLWNSIWLLASNLPTFPTRIQVTDTCPKRTEVDETPIELRKGSMGHRYSSPVGIRFQKSFLLYPVTQPLMPWGNPRMGFEILDLRVVYTLAWAQNLTTTGSWITEQTQGSRFR
jgi:hypothetical protein